MEETGLDLPSTRACLQRALRNKHCGKNYTRTLEWVEMTAALGSGSDPLPSLPQPRPRAPRLILGSAPSRF